MKGEKIFSSFSWYPMSFWKGLEFWLVVTTCGFSIIMWCFASWRFWLTKVHKWTIMSLKKRACGCENFSFSLIYKLGLHALLYILILLIWYFQFNDFMLFCGVKQNLRPFQKPICIAENKAPLTEKLTFGTHAFLSWADSCKNKNTKMKEMYSKSAANRIQHLSKIRWKIT